MFLNNRISCFNEEEIIETRDGGKPNRDSANERRSQEIELKALMKSIERRLSGEWDESELLISPLMRNVAWAIASLCPTPNWRDERRGIASGRI